MTKTILTILICVSSIGILIGQVEISGGIYHDTTFAEPISGVKLTLKSLNYKKTIKSDKKGQFRVLLENPNTEFSLEIKKRGYITLVIEFTNKESRIEFDVILKKTYGVHDKEYEGESKFIRRSQ